MSKAQKLQKFADDCFETARERAAAGQMNSARAHYELAEAYYRDASLARIKAGQGI